MTKLVILRHAEAHGNRDIQVCNNDDHNFLTLNGVAEAIAVVPKLMVRSYHAVFTSELTRSRHTASIILERTGEYHPSMPVKTGLLNEVGYIGSKQVETEQDVRYRAAIFFRDHVLPELEHGHVLVIGHGVFMKMVLTRFWELVPEIRRQHFDWGHCVPYVLDIEHVRKYVEAHPMLEIDAGTNEKDTAVEAFLDTFEAAVDYLHGASSGAAPAPVAVQETTPETDAIRNVLGIGR